MPISLFRWIGRTLTLLALCALVAFVGLIVALHALTGGPRERYPAPEEPLLSAAGTPVFVGLPSADRRVPVHDKVAVLTFDDGPSPIWTPALLEVLSTHGVPATFYVTGRQALAHGDLLRRVIDEGHEIGNHSFDHPAMGGESELRQALQFDLAQRTILARTGRLPVTYRPPYSSGADALPASEIAAADRAAERGMALVLSTSIPGDYRPGITAQRIVRRVLRDARSGEPLIVQLHDAGGNRSATVAAVDRLVPLLRARGYRFHTAAEIAGLGNDAMGHASRIELWSAQATLAIESVAFAEIAVQGPVRWAALGLAGIVLLRSLVLLALSMRHRRLTRWSGTFSPTSVAVIVPAFNEQDGIAETLRSIVANELEGLEVVVVDDGSTDRTAQIVADLDLPGVRLIRQQNAGKAAALNRGVYSCQSEFVVIVDGDSVLAPDALHRIVQPFEHVDVGAVAGNVRVANRRGLVGLVQHLEYVFGCGIERRMLDLMGAIGVVPGPAGAFRREALLDVGGVPHATITEDADLTLAVGRAGWRVVTVPDAKVYTEAPADWRSLWTQRYRWTFGALQTLWVHRGSALARGHRLPTGRLAVPYLIIFGPLLVLLGPILDLAVIIVLASGNVAALALLVAIVAISTIHHAFALHWDDDSPWLALATPLQLAVMRAFTYTVYYAAGRDLLMGRSPSWRKLARRGIDLSVAIPPQET